MWMWLFDDDPWRRDACGDSCATRCVFDVCVHDVVPWCGSGHHLHGWYLIFFYIEEKYLVVNPPACFHCPGFTVTKNFTGSPHTDRHDVNYQVVTKVERTSSLYPSCLHGPTRMHPPTPALVRCGAVRCGAVRCGVFIVWCAFVSRPSTLCL